MSSTKKLMDMVSSLPSTSETSGKSIVMANGGALERVSSTAYARTVKASISASSVLRISNIESLMIATRGSQAARCALLWVSSYGPGTTQRISHHFIKYSSVYRFYINGSSDSTACIYVAVDSSSADSIAATSFFGQTPVIETVAAVPSDAILLSAS